MLTPSVKPDILVGAATKLSACCQTGEPKSESPEQPFKTEYGPWDQGGVGACGYIALLNANIEAGANDEGGRFESKLRDCLEDAGIPKEDLFKGQTWEETMAIGECKEDVMEDEGYPVDIKPHRIDERTKLKAKCAEMASELDAGGGATLALRYEKDGRASVTRCRS